MATATRNAKNSTEKTTGVAGDTTEKMKASASDVSDAAFAYPKFEVPEMFRSFAEQGLNQTREVYARAKSTAEEATDLLEQSLESTRESMREVQFKALDVVQANADATFELFRRMLAAASVADAVQLQTAFVRERFDAFVDYSKDMQTTLTKVGSEAAKPAKAIFDRALNQAKAA